MRRDEYLCPNNGICMLSNGADVFGIVVLEISRDKKPCQFLGLHAGHGFFLLAFQYVGAYL